MSGTATEEVERLAKDTEIKSGMINMGERIHWGSETALMDQCAAILRSIAAERDALRAELAAEKALADRLYEACMGADYKDKLATWADYRKARGL